jgi:hypothetical protein
MLDDLLYESCSEDKAFPNRRRQCRGKFFRPRINFSFESKVGFFLERFNIIEEEVGYLTAKQQLCTALHWFESGSQWAV